MYTLYAYIVYNRYVPTPRGILPSLDGCRAVVTGSTRGLGFAFAQALCAEGAAVVVNGRTREACERARRALAADGGRVETVAGSVHEEDVADALVERCVERFGGVDFVVNNAGITRDRTLTKMTAADFDEVVATHLRGAWLVSRAAVRAMRAAGAGGSIVNVISGSGALFGLIGQSNYAAAKGGVLGLTRALSVELARHEIRVNALYPVAATDMTREVAERAGAAALPFDDPATVAPIVSYLASPQATSLTGQVIHFDGRELSVWTHPQLAATATRPAWDVHAIASFFDSHPPPIEPMHPDRWGVGATRGVVRARAYP